MVWVTGFEPGTPTSRRLCSVLRVAVSADACQSGAGNIPEAKRADYNRPPYGSPSQDSGLESPAIRLIEQERRQPTPITDQPFEIEFLDPRCGLLMFTFR
jgi:hypothetical protein